MSTGGAIEPHQARDVQEFVAGLRQLKERAGLTYRQLEERAAARGEVLPRSTLADVLGGKTAPRPELLAAFVRACGDGARVEEWTTAWEALTSRAASEGRDTTPLGTAPSPARLRGRRSRLLLLAAAAVLCLTTLTVWAVVVAGDGDPSDTSGPSEAAASDSAASPGDPAAEPAIRTSPNATSPSDGAPPEGPVWIRPALGDGLCLTDGFVPEHTAEVAVQRPCAELFGHRTRLLPAGDSHRIEWWREGKGAGCLEAITDDPPTAAGLLQPLIDCSAADLFTVERVGPRDGDRYVLRVADRGCVGIADASRSPGAVARLEPCRDTDSQQFLIQRAP